MHNNMLTRHELIGALRRVPIKEGRMITDITGYLDDESQFAHLLWFVGRLDSVHNYYKVESHAILTRALFLMYTHEFKMDFTSNVITYVNTLGNEVQVYVHTKEDLSLILYMFMESTKYRSESSYKYDDYRQATRAVTDHLEEDHDPRSTWRQVLLLTKIWFEAN